MIPRLEVPVIRLIRASMVAATLAALASLAEPRAQGAPTPYKLAMFQQGNRVFVGMVLNDEMVIDLGRTIAGTPPTIKGLIAQWSQPTADRFASVAADSIANPPASAMKVSQLKLLPPIADPKVLLSTAVNYQEHAVEMRSTTTISANAAAVDPKVGQGIPGYWERRPGDPRQNPYFFVKANTAITGHNDPIILPRGRDRIDWECEMNIVIGSVAKHVSRDKAAEYIFGYTLMNDVSDRGGRADGRHGSDWQLGKSHDTFAPLGPYVVPRQFVPNPQKLAVKFTLNDTVMQDSNTDRMTHTVFDLVEYASNMMTLYPGDLISTGSPAGVGTARATPVYFKPGDRSTCTIESIGTLRNTVEAEK
jgi:2-keto-4-pentenoate hydratase/2-oxohepta-3-ene-1,7-dioic acid hydratase in catechol pathway